jgi:hypothetical protein
MVIRRAGLRGGGVEKEKRKVRIEKRCIGVRK